MLLVYRASCVSHAYVGWLHAQKATALNSLFGSHRAGSPLPVMLARDRVFTPCLDGTERLVKQLDALIALNADVVAVQEVHADGVAAAYKARLSAAGYDILIARQSSMCGVLAARALIALLGVMAWAAVVILYAVAAGIYYLPSIMQLSHILHMCGVSVGCFIAYTWLRRTTLYNFLTNTVHGGLCLAYKRDVFAVSGSWTISFREQRGDFLNWWKLRAFQCAVLVPVHPTHGSGEHAICVVNVHMNLGDDGARKAQLEHAISFADGDEVRAATGSLPTSLVFVGDTNAPQESPSMQRMTTPRSNGGYGFVDVWYASRAFAEIQIADGATDCAQVPGNAADDSGHTWSGKNVLTRGFQLEPDGRLDWVFLRAAHVPLSQFGSDTRAAHHASADTRPAVAPVSACLALTEPFLSDHFAVHATFAVQTPGALDAQRPITPPRMSSANSMRLGCVSRAMLGGGNASRNTLSHAYNFDRRAWSLASSVSISSESSMSIDSAPSTASLIANRLRSSRRRRPFEYQVFKAGDAESSERQMSNRSRRSSSVDEGCVRATCNVHIAASRASRRQRSRAGSNATNSSDILYHRSASLPRPRSASISSYTSADSNGSHVLGYGVDALDSLDYTS